MNKIDLEFVAEEEESFKRRRAKNRSNDLKSPRQKYCERWEQAFPWLKADKIDECLGICTICDKRLVCKKSHLERHQNSYKHQRAMGFEVNLMKAEDDTNMDNDEFEDEQEIEHLEIDQNGELMEAAPVKIERAIINNSGMTIIPKKRLTKINVGNIANDDKTDIIRYKLLKRIDEERRELNDYFCGRQKIGSFSPPPRDTFDLFFDSVSASVKALPLKLGYEFKSRVSQLLTEFELRALCEKEAEEKAANFPNATGPVIVTPAFDENPKPAMDNITPVMYSFQPK